MSIMTADKNIKLIGYCELLETRGRSIANISNMILFSSGRNAFFAGLRAYIEFYASVKLALLQNFKNDNLFRSELQKLPDFHFEDYTISTLGFLFLILMFPLSGIIFLLQMSYLSKIRKGMNEMLLVNKEVLEKLKKEIR